MTVAPEVDTSSSPTSKEPQCMVVFDHCSVSSFSVYHSAQVICVNTANE